MQIVEGRHFTDELLSKLLHQIKSLSRLMWTGAVATTHEQGVLTPPEGTTWLRSFHHTKWQRSPSYFNVVLAAGSIFLLPLCCWEISVAYSFLSERDKIICEWGQNRSRVRFQRQYVRYIAIIGLRIYLRLNCCSASQIIRSYKSMFQVTILYWPMSRSWRSLRHLGRVPRDQSQSRNGYD